MLCPACARPIAMARANCVYCGAALSEAVQEEAARAAQKILQTRSLASLEAVAAGSGRDLQPRRYVVIDTSAAAVETIADACGVSAWEARQWQAASRYRLVRVSNEPADGPLESALKTKGLRVFIVPDETVARSRNPIPLESIDPLADPVQCTVREDPEAPPSRRALREQDLSLIVSASIKRQRVKDEAPRRTTADTRLEDAWLVHLHIRGEARPFEIDPQRTAYEGVGLASAYMRTLELVRRLQSFAPHDDAFKNVVPALSPGAEPRSGLETFASAASRKKSKEPKVVVLDNVAQFREYSAWRGAIEIAQQDEAPRTP
ncbi:MAG TPA: hypothetical protein PKU70_03240 [Vicinamibacteria bacterium]|nr:hypothetical protein [Vicinamibacteria bacterium]